MSLLRERQVYEAALRAKAKHGYAVNAQRILKEQTDPRKQRYDIFLATRLRTKILCWGPSRFLKICVTLFMLTGSRTPSSTATISITKPPKCFMPG